MYVLFKKITQPINSKYKEYININDNSENKINNLFSYFNKEENNNDKINKWFSYFNKEEKKEEKDPWINNDTTKQITVWFGMGFCSGVVIKKASKICIIVLGTSFICMQGLTYTKFIDINYKKMELDLLNLLDLNKDGKLDRTDFYMHYKKILNICKFNVPSGSSYTAGFILGLKNG